MVWARMENMFLDILRRTLAVIVLNVTGSFVGGSVIGLQVWQSALMAGLAGALGVAQDLSRNYLDDGKLDKAEINEIYSKIAKDSEKE